MANDRNQDFLKYTLSTQLEASKRAAFESHYGAIRREMVRRGTWREGLRFADVGCGLGLYSEFWQSRGFEVVGIDLNQAPLAIARARGASQHAPIQYAAASATALPFRAGTFDVVFAMSLLEHVPDWRTCVRELTRLVAPGGLLWLETTNVVCPRQREFRWLPLYSWWPRPAKRVAETLARGPIPVLANYTPWPAVHWFSYFKLRRFLQEEGFLVSDRFDCMDVSAMGAVKSLARRVALSSDATRGLTYLLVSSLIVLATRPATANG